MRFVLRSKDNNGQAETHYVNIEKIPGDSFSEDETLRIEANGQVIKLAINAGGFVNINPKPDIFSSNDVRLFVHFPSGRGRWFGLQELAERVWSGN